MEWPWMTVFHGHKSCDVDPYEGPVPLKHDAADAGGVNVVFPLRHWTDDDVWQYIEDNHVDYDKRRYAGHLEVPDKWLNSDFIHACTLCCDPRNTTDTEVFCPKLKRNVPNVGSKVLILDQLPNYIRRPEAQPV
jgi:3'-phosphoadenosine 5'-phosphosulfate sulfotransferase (PAPS reductase)/FAD synthetase